MKRRFSFGYFFKEGLHSIFTHSVMSIAAVCMIICCLLIMGSFSLVAVNVDHMLGKLEQDNEFLAYIDETYDDAQIAQLQQQIEALPNVRSVELVGREEAMDAFKADKADNPLFQTLPNDVFRDRFRIHVHDIEKLGGTVEQVKGLEGVANYRAELEVAEGFVIVRNIASGVAVILVIVLLAMSLFIIVNTIKLATFTRRDEIAIMKMCGATNAFVRWPFVFEGVILGLVGAIAGFFIQWGVYTLVGRAIITADTIQLVEMLPFRPMALKIFGVFGGVGLMIGAGGSMLAIRKFLQV